MEDQPPVPHARIARRTLLTTGALGGGTLGAGALTACSGTSDPQGRDDPERSNGPESDPERTSSAGAESCTAPELAPAPRSEPATDLDELFTRYGNESGQWSGADSTYSVVMPDGSIAWLFSDTFLGPVAADGTRAEDTPFLHNSIVAQAAPGSGDLRTVHSTGEDGAPAAAVPSTEPDTWNWLGAGIVGPDGNLQVTTLAMAKTGDGILDFAWQGRGLATVDLTEGTVLSRAALPADAGIQWSAWLQGTEDGSAVHVYGVRDGETKTLHVARVPAEQLAEAAAWEFWDGSAWSDAEADAAVIARDVANELSVTRFEGGHLLVTQDTSEALGRRIVGATACGPTGPFAQFHQLAEMREAGPDGTYGNENIYGYNAHEHPWMREGRELVISYNVHSLVAEDLYADATVYRPRFVRVRV